MEDSFAQNTLEAFFALTHDPTTTTTFPDLDNRCVITSSASCSQLSEWPMMLFNMPLYLRQAARGRGFQDSRTFRPTWVVALLPRYYRLSVFTLSEILTPPALVLSKGWARPEPLPRCAPDQQPALGSQSHSPHLFLLCMWACRRLVITSSTFWSFFVVCSLVGVTSPSLSLVPHFCVSSCFDFRLLSSKQAPTTCAKSHRWVRNSEKSLRKKDFWPRRA